MVKSIGESFRTACLSESWVKNPGGLLLGTVMTGLTGFAFSRNYDPLFSCLTAGLNFYLIRSSYLRGSLRYIYQQRSDVAKEMARELQENENIEFPSKDVIEFRKYLEKVMPDTFKDAADDNAKNVEAALTMRLANYPEYNWRKDTFHLGTVGTLIAMNLAILAGQIHSYQKAHKGNVEHIAPKPRLVAI